MTGPFRILMVLYFICLFALAGLGPMGLPQVLVDIFVTPFYVIFPVGLGCLLIAIVGGREEFQKKVTRDGQVVLGSIIGIVLITYTFYFLEQYGYLKSFIAPVFFTFKALSLIGVLLFFGGLPKAPTKMPWSYVSLAALVASLSFYLKFVHFSDFPLMDVFQNVHFMKGGHELARFGILNRETANSYMPTLQVFWGLFHKYYGFNLFAANTYFIVPTTTHHSYFQIRPKQFNCLMLRIKMRVELLTSLSKN